MFLKLIQSPGAQELFELFGEVGGIEIKLVVEGARAAVVRHDCGESGRLRRGIRRVKEEREAGEVRVIEGD